MYSQTKLSKGEDNSISSNKIYKEIDIKYGSEIKMESNFELKYTESHKLKDIENFLIEFYICKKNSNIYYDTNKDLAYYNKDILRIFEEMFSVYKNEDYEKIVNMVNLKLYEAYLNEPNYEKIRHEALDGSESSYLESNRMNIHNIEENKYNKSKFLNITRYHFLKEIFKDNKIDNGGIIDNTLILSKLSNAIEDESICLSKLSNISKFDYTNNDNNEDNANLEITFKEISKSNFNLNDSPIFQSKKVDFLEEKFLADKINVNQNVKKPIEKKPVRNNSFIVNKFYININNSPNKKDKGQNQLLKYIYNNIYNDSQSEDIPNHISSNEYDNL